MKKYILFLLAFFLFPFPLWAQESVPISSVSGPVESAIRPVISGDDIVGVSRNIILDGAGTTFLNPDEEAQYIWDMGDGTQLQGQEVVHTYREPGRYEVKLAVIQGDQEGVMTKEIVAYNKLMFLITDATEWQENIENLQKDAEEKGIYIYVLESYQSDNAFISEESLYSKLNDQLPLLGNADGIAIWTTRGSGINALTRLVQQSLEQGNTKLRDLLHEKSLVVVTEENIGTLSRILQGNYNIIQPKQIIITRNYKLEDFMNAESDEHFLETLEKSVADYAVINTETGKPNVWNFMAYLVSFMVSKGIPSNTIMLLLMLPVIATLIAIFKQVVGVTTFGVYTPSIITLSFLALGLKFGLLIFVIIIVSGAVLRRLLNHFHLLYIPKVSIILSISTLIILLTLALGTYLSVSSIATIAVFPMLIMTTLAERFVTALGGKGFYSAILLMLETLLVSLVCYWVVEWHFLQNFILGYPEIVFLLIAFNYVLGRWSGLRLMEYVRFREVMKHTEE